MATPADYLLMGQARTTAATTLGAAVAMPLPRLGIRAAGMHRLAWLLVILQGWLLVPFTIEIASSATMLHLTKREPAVASVTNRTAHDISAATRNLEDSNRLQSWTLLAAAGWILGPLVLLSHAGWRYLRLRAHLPLGAVPDRQDWHDEWRRAVDRVRPRAKVQLRVTKNFGPLLCFVPFAYFVLVPKVLWSCLNSCDREAILRHELAHLRRRDLWKNLAVRLLALPQWFNPVAWLAVRRFEEAGEWACDEVAIVNTDSSRTDYAETLLRVAGFAPTTTCGTVAATGGVLTRRVARLLAMSDKEKEVSDMKNAIVPLFLLTLGLAQTIRVETVMAEAAEQVPGDVPHEFDKISLPPYVIEPPDILLIESGVGQIEGEHLVGPDGQVNLGAYGRIYLAGKTLEEARQSVETHLREFFVDPQVVVDVFAYNSKKYYIVTKGGAAGDNVIQVPITGNETVLDAVARLGGIAISGQTRIWVSRPPADGVGVEQMLPVNWEAVARGASTASNYQLMPGDRVFVEMTKSPEVADTPLVESSASSADEAIQSTPRTRSPILPPLTAAEVNQVRVMIQIVEDTKGNLAELEGLDEGNAVIGDATSMVGLIRILAKNELARILAAPSVITKHNTEAAIAVGSLRVEITPRPRPGGTLLETRVRLERGEEISELRSEPILRVGQTYAMRLAPRGATAEAPTYVVLTREHLR